MRPTVDIGNGAEAKSLGVKGTNLHVWFATTGKKHAKKIGRGHYRLKK